MKCIEFLKIGYESFAQVKFQCAPSFFFCEIAAAEQQQRKSPTKTDANELQASYVSLNVLLWVPICLLTMDLL